MIIRIRLVVGAGEAKAGPPLSPILGQYQVDVNAFCKEFNEKTQNFAKGVPLPVLIRKFNHWPMQIVIRKPTLTFLVSHFLAEDGTISTLDVYNLFRIFKSLHKGANRTDKDMATILFGFLKSMRIIIK